MKILLATKLMDVGGIERSVVAIASELKSRGHRVWVVSSGGYLVRDLDRAGTPHVHAPLVLSSPLGVLRSAGVIRRLIRQQRIELVHSFSATASVAVNLALRTARGTDCDRVHLVSSPMGLQNSAAESASTTWLRNWLLTLGAQRILVISPEIRRHLRQVGAREDHLIDFNFVGLNPDTFLGTPDDATSVRREFGFPRDAQIISTIGALHPRKSHELFVEAAAAVAARLPRAHFLVVGDGEQRAELEDLARGRGLAGRVYFTGVRDDVARLLSATDVYVKPGVVEGFVGITVLEALALAKPVIAFDTEDVKLALTDGVTGAVVPNGDWQALADKVVYLLDHPREGRQLGEAGQKLVREQFHFGLLAQRLEAFYRQLLAAPGPSEESDLVTASHG